MQTKYLFLFRMVLGSTLLLYSLNAPALHMSPWLLGTLYFAYVSVAFALLWIGRVRSFNELAVFVSFMFDIAATSSILYLTEGFQSEFYVAYFLVIMSTCFLERLVFSFVVGGVACIVYSYFAFPGWGGIHPFYLLRSSLLLVTAFFSTYIADTVRRSEQAAVDRYSSELAWMQRLSLIGKAMSSLLHEVKTPLSSILLNVEQIQDLLQQGKKIDGPLESITHETESTLAALTDFLDFSRPKDLDLKPQDLNRPLQRALEAIRLRIQDRDITVETDLNEMTMVLCSERHLTQAFTNVMLNAIDAMPAGGLLQVRRKIHEGKVSTDFIDNGMGMGKETLERLFEPFFTGKPETGHGLGLTIVRWTVQKHSGELTIRSDGPGTGTTVRISLPLAPQLQQAI